MAHYLTSNEKFHLFSKTPTSGAMQLSQAVNKAGHTIVSSDVWADDIPWFITPANETDALNKTKNARTNDLIKIGDTVYKRNATKRTDASTFAQLWEEYTLSNGTKIYNKDGKHVLTYHKGAVVTLLTPANNSGQASFQAGRIWAGEDSHLVEQFVAATDKIHDGYPSLGYNMSVANKGSNMSEGEQDADFIVNAYAGVVHFNKSYEGVQYAFTANVFEYVGAKLDTTVSSLVQRITDVEAEVGGGTGSGSVSERLATAESDIDALQGDVNTLKETVKSQLTYKVVYSVDETAVTYKETETGTATKCVVNTVYLVADDTVGAYVEYLCYKKADGALALEQIGTTDTDLDGYATDTEVSTAISDAKKTLVSEIAGQGASSTTHLVTATVTQDTTVTASKKYNIAVDDSKLDEKLAQMVQATTEAQTDADNAAAAAKSAGDKANQNATDITAIETLIGNLPEGAEAKTIVAYAQEVADAAKDAAIQNAKVTLTAGNGIDLGDNDGEAATAFTIAAKLTDSTSSEDTSTAASAKAVKSAYDTAQSKISSVTGDTSDSLVKVSASTDASTKAVTLDVDTTGLASQLITEVSPSQLNHGGRGIWLGLGNSDNGGKSIKLTIDKPVVDGAGNISSGMYLATANEAVAIAYSRIAATIPSYEANGLKFTAAKYTNNVPTIASWSMTKATTAGQTGTVQLAFDTQVTAGTVGVVPTAAQVKNLVSSHYNRLASVSGSDTWKGDAQATSATATSTPEITVTLDIDGNNPITINASDIASKAALDYLRETVRGHISDAAKLSIIVANASTDADRHPAVDNPSTNKIYLVKATNDSPEAGTYAEWIYVDGNWEKIGTTATDLSEYAKTASLKGSVSGNGISVTLSENGLSGSITTGSVASGNTSFVTGGAVHSALATATDNNTTTPVVIDNVEITTPFILGTDTNNIASVDVHVESNGKVVIDTTGLTKDKIPANVSYFYYMAASATETAHGLIYTPTFIMANGSRVYVDDTSIKDGNQLFMNSSLKSIGHHGSNHLVLPNLVRGEDMFRTSNQLRTVDISTPSMSSCNAICYECLALESFSNTDMSNVESATSGFYRCSKLTTFDAELPQLKDGSRMFFGCTSLTSFHHDLPSLTDSGNMFNYCTALTSFRGDLSSLENGQYMFLSCQLSSESLMYIADTIKDWTGATQTHMIHIGIGSTTPTTEEHEYLTEIHNKGWDVFVNGNNPYTPTDGASIAPETGDTTTLISFKAKPVVVETEEEATYVAENGAFYNIVGAQFIYVDDPEAYGEFVSFDHAEREIMTALGLTKIVE